MLVMTAAGRVSKRIKVVESRVSHAARRAKDSFPQLPLTIQHQLERVQKVRLASSKDTLTALTAVRSYTAKSV